MTEVNREVLVLITDQVRRSAVINELRRVVTVVQLLPPEIVTVILTPEQRKDIPRIAGTTFYLDVVPIAVVDALPAQEQVFVRAWQARRGAKTREGDHLPWDANGFTPPD